MTTKNITKILTLGLIIIAATMSGCVDSDNIGERPSTVTTTPGTSASVSDVGTYLNPVVLNNMLISDTGIFGIGIGKISRGEGFNNYIKNENMFNGDPKPRYEYMGVLISFTYVGEDQYMLSGYDFKAYANDVECNSVFVVTPDEFTEMEMTTNIMPGGTIAAWKIFEVPIDTQVTLSYERMFDKAYYLDCGSDNFVADLNKLVANI